LQAHEGVDHGRDGDGARGTSVRGGWPGRLAVTEAVPRRSVSAPGARPMVDGRAGMPPDVDGFEEVMDAILWGLRTTDHGRGSACPGAGGLPDSSARSQMRRQLPGGRAPSATPLSRSRVRTRRNVEMLPNVRAQHDWFDVQTRLRDAEPVGLQALSGVLSHSRARFCWTVGKRIS